MRNKEELAEKINEFEKAIGYEFKEKWLLFTALTHSSYANEMKKDKVKSNERLEFLGDALLDIVISEELFVKFEDADEGWLTKTRAIIVCEGTLASCAKKIRIGDYLLLGKGEELSGGRKRASILSDAFEALIGAVFMDSDPTRAKGFILSLMDDIITEAEKGNIFSDFKTQLQELVQKKCDSNVCYQLIEEKGPDHNKVFKVEVRLKDEVLGTGEGKTKKEAEQNAARVAIEKV